MKYTWLIPIKLNLFTFDILHEISVYEIQLSIGSDIGFGMGQILVIRKKWYQSNFNKSKTEKVDHFFSSI